MGNDKGEEFRQMHRRGDPFVLANAWDAGSAKMLVALGAKAIATSSAAHAFTLGRADMGHVTRDEALAHAQDLVAAVDVPVSGDFENGYGASPETCAETVRMAAEVGLAGICIEDTALPSSEPYEREHAVERIAAAVSAARALSKDFFLFARADGIMTGAYDIEEALARTIAFDKAGADGLYVPLPKSPDDLLRVIKSTAKPVNVLAAGPYAKLTRAQYARMGAARISIGSALARVTHRVILDAGTAMFGKGDFSPLTKAAPGATIDEMLK